MWIIVAVVEHYWLQAYNVGDIKGANQSRGDYTVIIIIIIVTHENNVYKLGNK